MIFYTATINDQNCPNNGQIIGNTKNGTYKGMSKEKFIEEVSKSTCFKFIINETIIDYSTHRKYLNDKWP